jgi:hypothetical protein
MSDWYEEGYDQLIEDIVKETKVSKDHVKLVYSYLVNVGIIDYDIEKEVIFGLYGEEEEE